MAVTIKSNARGWNEVSSTAYWTARSVWDTGSALYAVVQDTGATPKVRVMKADAYPEPTSWSEQDSADNKAIANVDYPYSSWLDGDDLHIAVFTDTNDIEHHIFDISTDQWSTGYGQIANDAASNERPIRLSVRSDGDVICLFTSLADDADIISSTWEGSIWTGAVIFNQNNTEASTLVDMVMDSADYATYWVHDVNADDFSYRSRDGSNADGTLFDFDTSVAADETLHCPGARFNVYDNSGTETVIPAYIDGDGGLDERVTALEAASTSGNVSAVVAIEGTATSIGTRTPISTAVIGGTPYAAWWDDANSGTIKYSTKTASGGTAWEAETDFATSITRLIEIVPVSPGLAVVYQSGSDVVMDWIVSPSSNVTVNGSHATASASANSGSKVIDVTGSNATASASANAGTVKIGYTVNGSLATASALANAGTWALDLSGALATASANAYTGQLSFKPAASLATATALANAGTPTIDIQGSLATASALANASTVAVDIMGSHGTASAEAFFGTQEVGVKINGSLATASAQAFSGTTAEITGDIEERSGYFQLRPILEVDA